MYTQYCLNQDTLSVSVSDSSRREFAYIPAGTVIYVSQPEEGKLVEVVWNNHKVLMFSEDIHDRANPLFDVPEPMVERAEALHAS